MGLREVEQRLERLVEGAFSKGVRGGLEPVEAAVDSINRYGIRGANLARVAETRSRRPI